MITEVYVDCDSPKHARGKVAKIAVFAADLDNGTVEEITPKRKHRTTKYRGGRAVEGIVRGTRAGAETELDFAPHMNRNDWFYWTRGAYPYVCKLCNQQVLPSGDLHAALLKLAGDGVTKVSLSVLASMLPT